MYLLYFEVVFWEDGKSVTKTARVISLKAELQNNSSHVTTVTKNALYTLHKQLWNLH